MIKSNKEQIKLLKDQGCNLVFSDEDNKILYKKIIKEFKGISILFDYDDVLSRFLIKKYNVKTSWSKYQIVYIFNIFWLPL